VDEFDIYIRGFIARASEPPDAGLQRVFGIDRDRARELIRSLPRVVKRHVQADELARYEQALRELGADFELRRSPIRPAQIIAVRGQEPQADAAREQHGSTLTLPPPKVESAQAQSSGSTQRAAGRRFAQTVVGSAEQARAAASTLEAPPLDPDYDADDVILDPVKPAQALPSRAAFDAATLPAALPAVPAPARYADLAPARPPAQQYGGFDSAPLPASPAAQVVATAPAPSPQAVGAWNSGDAWAPVEPAPGTIGAGTGELPAPWEVPGLRLDGRPGWLVEGPLVHQADHGHQADQTQGAYAMSDPGGLEPIVSDPAPAAQPSPAQLGRGARRPIAGHPVGNVIGRELAYEPSLALRIALRVGIGVSLFLIVLAVRHAPVFNRRVERAFVQFAEGAAQDSESARAGDDPSGAHANTTGPDAAAWMQSDLHQFTDGDKDRVSSLVDRFNRAGARAVRVGHIMRSGMVQIGGELIVELPDEPAPRKAVLQVYQTFLQSTFGGLASEPPDPGGQVLRVAL
jgi:hypothetical protein